MYIVQLYWSDSAESDTYFLDVVDSIEKAQESMAYIMSKLDLEWSRHDFEENFVQYSAIRIYDSFSLFYEKVQPLDEGLKKVDWLF